VRSWELAALGAVIVRRAPGRRRRGPPVKLTVKLRDRCPPPHPFHSLPVYGRRICTFFVSYVYLQLSVCVCVCVFFSHRLEPPIRCRIARGPSTFTFHLAVDQINTHGQWLSAAIFVIHARTLHYTFSRSHLSPAAPRIRR